jgi:hypothetical protein
MGRYPSDVSFDDVFGALWLCLAAGFAAAGVVTLVTGRVPGRGALLAGWRAYPPRRAGPGLVGVGGLWAVIGFGLLAGGRWQLALLGLVCLVLLAVFVGWLVRTWKRSNRV